MSTTLLDLAQPCTQERFGQLVGIGQPAVSALLDDDTLQRGDTVAAWLLDYCKNLREQAAGRGMDGELAFQRARLARVTSEEREDKLAVLRKNYGPASAVKDAIAATSKIAREKLEALPLALHKRHPELTPEALKLIRDEISFACDMAAHAALQAIKDLDAEIDDAQDSNEQEDEITSQSLNGD